MLQGIFITVLNMSLTASYVALFVFILRLLLKRAPKGILYALWSIVLIRAICPVSFSSVISLFGHLGSVNTSVSHGAMHYIPENIGMSAEPTINVRVTDVSNVINDSLPAPTPVASADPMQIIITVAMIIWLVGVAAMLAYSIISYTMLKRRISASIQINKNVYESDQIRTAFVCGFFKPRIYLPVALDESSRNFVLAHERIHIRRRDYLIKPIAFLALSLHWFNPFMWAAYFLMAKDMEMSCDERALKSIGSDEKENYCNALLTLSAERRIIAGSPLAFGENSTKTRVKNALNYKRPAFWMVLIAVVAGVAAGICLLANPNEKLSIDVDEIKSVIAWNDETGIRRELPAGDFDNICELVSSAKNVRDNPEFAGTTPVYGINITTKDGKEISINECFGDVEVQRDGRSWFIDDADLASFIHDTCAVDAEAPDESLDETTSGVATNIPDGFIVNEVGATDAEIVAIFADVKNSFYDSYDVDYVAKQGIHLYIYARQDWHEGALLLAGLSPMGEQPPELYFINDSGMVMRTSGSDVWSINYTHYAGETIVFGESFAWDNGPLATDEVTAEFWSGETVTVPMEYAQNSKDDVTRGYICVAPSITWLKSLKILKDDNVVMDDVSGTFLSDPANEPWYGEPESIRNRTGYVGTSDVNNAVHTNIIDFFGGYPSITVETGDSAQPLFTSELTYWPNCPAHEGISPDIWHSNNALHGGVVVTAGSRISAEVTAVTDNAEDHVKADDLNISKIYWVDLSVKDDEKCITEGELICPVKKGYYVLILSTDYGNFAKTIRVM